MGIKPGWDAWGTQTGSLPRDTIVSVDAEQGEWLNVTTRAGFTVWVSRDHIEIIDFMT